MGPCAHRYNSLERLVKEMRSEIHRLQARPAVTADPGKDATIQQLTQTVAQLQESLAALQRSYDEVSAYW